MKKFFHEQNCRSEDRIRERIEAIHQAVPATEDRAIVEGGRFKARAWVKLIATLRTVIAEADQKIEELVDDHPDASLFASLPGAGPVLVPRLIVSFGTQRDRFQSASEVQESSGIAPVTVRSGNTEFVQMRRACPKFTRQTFHEFAAHSIAQSEWAEVFYTAQRDQGKDHHAAVRALAYRWIRIIFRCWRDGKPYDEQVYMRSLQRRGSPLIGSFRANTEGEWKLVAGFQKFSAKNS